MPRPTVARVDLDAVTRNLGAIRRLVGDRKVCVAVKADAYGHGAPLVARALGLVGVDMFGVAITEEAVDLRHAGVTQPVILLAGVPPEDIDDLLAFDVAACVNEKAFARELSARALQRHVVADVHVNVDTGMRRQGLDWETAAPDILDVVALKGLRVAGVFSHLACAGEADLSFSREQVRRFRSVLDQLKAAGMEPPLAHMANSNGVLRLPESHFDAVRPGLITYGLYSREDLKVSAGLRAAMSLRTRISHLKRVARGESISYGRTFTTERDSVIAALPIGYHDGYDRGFSNAGEVLVRGRRAPVVGIVCMDQTLIDVTDVPDVQPGDEAVLYGEQGNERITIEDAGRRIGRISYELVCMLGRRVRREYVLNGKVVTSSPPRSVVPDETLARIFGVGSSANEVSG
jgi:alanine racemase